MHIQRPSWYYGNIPWLFATRAVRSFSQAMLVVVVPLYVAAAGYSILQVGYLLSIAMVGSTAMTLLVGILSDRFGRKIVLIAIAALAAVGSAVYALNTRFWVLALMSALASVRGGGAGSGGGFGPFYPAEQALIAGSSPDRHRNTVFSSLSLVGVLAGAAGSVVAALPGILRKRLGMSAVVSFHPVFWIAAVSGFLVVLLTLPIHETRVIAPIRVRRRPRSPPGN
jgi:MFS family permease